MLWVRIPIMVGVLDTALCDKVCQRLATCQWCSPGTPVSSTNKTDFHDITHILLKVALNTITLTQLPVSHATCVPCHGLEFQRNMSWYHNKRTRRIICSEKWLRMAVYIFTGSCLIHCLTIILDRYVFALVHVVVHHENVQVQFSVSLAKWLAKLDLLTISTLHTTVTKWIRIIHRTYRFAVNKWISPKGSVVAAIVW